MTTTAATTITVTTTTTILLKVREHSFTDIMKMTNLVILHIYGDVGDPRRGVSPRVTRGGEDGGEGGGGGQGGCQGVFPPARAQNQDDAHLRGTGLGFSR